MRQDILISGYQEELLRRAAKRRVAYLVDEFYDGGGFMRNESKESVYRMIAPVLFKRLYSEVPSGGHLGRRLRDTKEDDYLAAIREISDWRPKCGMTGIANYAWSKLGGEQRLFGLKEAW